MKPRIKMHQLPGDVPKRIKIAMLEGKPLDVTGEPELSKPRCKSYKKLLKLRERAALKRQAQTEIDRS